MTNRKEGLQSSVKVVNRGGGQVRKMDTKRCGGEESCWPTDNDEKAEMSSENDWCLNGKSSFLGLDCLLYVLLFVKEDFSPKVLSTNYDVITSGM